MNNIKSSDIKEIFAKNLELFNETKEEINNSIVNLRKTKGVIDNKIKTLNNSTRKDKDKKQQEIAAYKTVRKITNSFIADLKKYKNDILKTNFINKLKKYKENFFKSTFNGLKNLGNQAKKSNKILTENLRLYTAY
jgi:hypothetical protein